jgi:Skp family chaperone for outer membrane proteins
MEQSEKRQIRWYEIVYVLVLIALLGFGVMVMNPHKVAVLDVDRVFKELGLPQKIEKDRAKLDAYVRGTSLLQAYNTRMNSLKEKLDAAKTQVEKDKIQGQVKAAHEQFQSTVAPIQSALQSYESNVVATFRRRLQPFVAKVAQKRRADIVMVAAPNMLYVRNKADITDDVIAAGKSFFEKEMPLIDPALNGAKPAPLNNK